MHRRSFLSVAGGAILAGCTEDGGTSDKSTRESSTPSPTESPTDVHTATAEATAETEFDVEVEYSVHVQESAAGEYDLPEPRDDGWGWVVLDLSVTDGALEMGDVWFNAFFETRERLLAVAHDSDTVEDGVTSSGSIREGGRGVVLHDYPPSPASDPVGWNVSPMDQSVGGEGVITDGPDELYPSVTLEYSVETRENPEVLPDSEAERRGENERWVVVSISVVEGHLNMEDVWFRSQLVTGSRTHTIAHASSNATRGVRSRGMVKPEYKANAVYLVGADESVEEWGFSEERRQDGPVSRS